MVHVVQKLAWNMRTVEVKVIAHALSSSFELTGHELTYACF